MLEFQATLVQLLIGALFVLIAASVSPVGGRARAARRRCARRRDGARDPPAGVALATWRSRLTLRERAFVAWMAPRGIVAGATASAFGLELAGQGVAGAQHLLPIAFVAIFGTVVLYGLTAAPVARCSGVAGASGTRRARGRRHAWARALASALKRAGVAVRLWVGHRRRPGGGARGRPGRRARADAGRRGQPRGRARGGHGRAAGHAAATTSTRSPRPSCATSSATGTSTASPPTPRSPTCCPPFGDQRHPRRRHAHFRGAPPPLRGGRAAGRGAGQRRRVRWRRRPLRGHGGRRPACRVRRQAAACEGRRPGHRAGGRRMIGDRCSRRGRRVAVAGTGERYEAGFSITPAGGA